MPAVVLLAGCGEASGMGWTDGTGGKATFGFRFVVTSISGEPLEGDLTGSYHDPQGFTLATGEIVDVDFKGAGHQGPQPTPSDLPEGTLCIGGPFEYEVQNNKIPPDPVTGNGGHAFLILCDLGEPGASEGDHLIMSVINGPYAGYTKVGKVLGGNIQVK